MDRIPTEGRTVIRKAMPTRELEEETIKPYNMGLPCWT